MGRCYNCAEKGHRADACPEVCWRCGGDHWFVKCKNSQEKEIQIIFDKLDRGNKGFITREDLVHSVVDYKFHDEESCAQEVLDAIQPRDTSHVTLTEFQEYVRSREGRLRDMFKEMDDNDSGSISRHEFRTAMQKLRLNPTEDEVRAMIRLVDRPSAGGKLPPNGKIEFPEFREFMVLVNPSGRFLDFSPLADEWLHSVSIVPTMGTQTLGKEKAVKTAVCGGLASAFSRCAVAPLERLRLQMIVDPTRYSSTWQCFRSIYATEGITGYWRGNVLNMLRIGPQGAIAFVAKDYYKTMLGGANPSPLQLAGASMLSGMTCMTAIYPLDMIRGRITTTPGAYTGIGNAFATVVKQEGAPVLYRGLAAANLWAVPYYGTQFFVYDSLKRAYAEYGPRKTNGEAPKAGVALGLVFGAVSGICCTAAAFPFESIRRRLQVQGIGGRPVIYKGIADCAAKVVKEEGVLGLFSGLKANTVKSPINIAIAFGAYETLSKLIM